MPEPYSERNTVYPFDTSNRFLLGFFPANSYFMKYEL